MARQTILMCALLLTAGCGDDDRPLPMNDAGPGGKDSALRDAGPPGSVATFRGRFVGRDDMPLEGVKLAVDSDLGRVEGVTNASGEVVLDVPYMVERFNMIAAKETYAVFARVRFTMADLGTPEADGFYPVQLREVAFEPPMMTVQATATGVPAGGRWCASVASFLSLCTMEGMAVGGTGRFTQLEFSSTLTAAAFDASGELVDFVEIPWGTDEPLRHIAAVAFDGTFDAPPTTTAMSITLPSDPMSPFRTATLDPTWQGWVVGVSVGTNLSRTWLSDIVIGADTIDMNVHAFSPAEDLVWASAAYADFDDPVRSFRWWETVPEPGPIAILDVPRVTAAATWNGDITWTEPAPDVAVYQVSLWNNANRVVATVISPTTQARLPELPTGFDSATSFPFPGSTGEVQVAALRGAFGMMGTRDPLAANAEASLGPRAVITF